MAHSIMAATINLACGDYFGLILPRSTGVIFTNQVGGHACNHPQQEGIFIPLDDGIGRPTRHVFAQHFTGSWATLMEKDAIVIDRAMRKGHLEFIQVDRSKLNDSLEAWVYVTLDLAATDYLIDIGTNRGILTWQNSD
jgi:uncharacterized protein DUF6210